MLDKLVQVRAAKEKEALLDLADAERRVRDQESVLATYDRRRNPPTPVEDASELALRYERALRGEMARREAEVHLAERQRESDQHRARLVRATRSTRAAEALADAHKARRDDERRRADAKQQDALGLRTWQYQGS